MLDYNGEMADKSRHTNYLMDVDDNDGVVASITISEYNEAVDSVMMETFDHTPCEQALGDDHKFLDAISERAEVSKMMGTIGSVRTSGVPCNLFNDPIGGTIDELRELLSDVIDADMIAKIEAIKVSNARGVSKEFLSKIWVVSEHLAQGAIDQNTQLSKHHADNSLSRHFSTNDRMLRYKRLKSVFFTDTLLALSTKSTRGNTYAQIFVSDKGYVAVYPMKSQSEFQNALHWFCKEVGVPSTLVMDGHRAQKNLETRRFCHQVGTIMRVLEEGTPWANRAELYIGLHKEAVRQDMRRSNAPIVLWDYCLERRANIHNAIPRPLFQNNGATPHEATFGEQGDISNICNFGWYQ